MERCEHYREACCVDVVGMWVDTHEAAHHVDERIEAAEHPYHTEHVEREVGEGCTARLCVGTHRCDVRGDGGADVLAQYQCDTHVNRQHARRAEHHRDSHEGCRRLHAERQHGADAEEREYSEIAILVEGSEEVDDSLVVTEVHLLTRCAERRDSEEHECHAEEEVADVAVALAVDE